MAFIHSDQARLSLYMRTCRTLYEYGVPFLAEDCRVDVANCVPSFCDFMLRDPTRPTLVSHLKLVSRGSRPGAYTYLLEIPVFKDVLHATTRLTSLSLTTAVVHELLPLSLYSHPLLESISSFKGLQELKLMAVNKLANKILDRVRAPLRKVVLEYATVNIRLRDLLRVDLDFLDPLFLLFRYRDTLREIEVYEHPNPGYVGMKEVQLPHVYTFTYTSGTLAHVHLDGMSHALPNVQKVFFTATQDLSPPRRDLRSIRKEHQEGAIGNALWTSVDELSCNTPWLYAMAWNCPTRFWHGTHVNGRTLPCFQDVFDGIRPEHLDLTIHANSFKRIEDLSSLFVTEIPVTHLNVDLEGMRDNSVCFGMSVTAWFLQLFVSP